MDFSAFTSFGHIRWCPCECLYIYWPPFKYIAGVVHPSWLISA